MSMVPPNPGTVLVPLAVSLLPSDPEGSTGIPCLGCKEPLSLHQPNLNAPERLLGACDACGAWHLIDRDRALMVLLPNADGLRNDEAHR